MADIEHCQKCGGTMFPDGVVGMNVYVCEVCGNKIRKQKQ